MIPIYLCDDDPVWLNLLKKYIDDFIFQKDINMEIVCSSSDPDNLLKYRTSHSIKRCVYFLDVDLKAKLNGMELALKIREIDPRGFIIFVTIHEDMAFKTFQYKVEAMDYIIKDGFDIDSCTNLKQQVFSCLSRIAYMCKNKEQALPDTISVRCCGSDYFVSIDDIMFIETIKRSHKLRIHLQSNSLEISSSLSDMQSKLGDCFFLCHKTNLVNLLHIKEISYSQSEAIMENGGHCPCSLRKLPELHQMVKALHKL